MTEIRRLNDVEAHILTAVEQIKYGAVEVLIHDSKVVQIQRSEKIRFENKRNDQL